MRKIESIPFDEFLDLSNKVKAWKLDGDYIEGILPENKKIILGVAYPFGKFFKKFMQERFICLKKGEGVIDQYYIISWYTKDYRKLNAVYNKIKSIFNPLS